MASSMSGQDTPNPAQWLSTRAGKIVISCQLKITPSWSINTLKELGKYPAIVTACLVNNPYIPHLTSFNFENQQDSKWRRGWESELPRMNKQIISAINNLQKKRSSAFKHRIRYLPFEQSFPVHPDRQEHWKSFAKLVQVPPFWQGWVAQKSRAVCNSQSQVVKRMLYD